MKPLYFANYVVLDAKDTDLYVKQLLTNCFIMKGLNNSRAIFLGSPHWWNFALFGYFFCVRAQNQKDVFQPQED